MKQAAQGCCAAQPLASAARGLLPSGKLLVVGPLQDIKYSLQAIYRVSALHSTAQHGKAYHRLVAFDLSNWQC